MNKNLKEPNHRYSKKDMVTIVFLSTIAIAIAYVFLNKYIVLISLLISFASIVFTKKQSMGKYNMFEFFSIILVVSALIMKIFYQFGVVWSAELL